VKAKRTSVILSITYESNQCRYYTGIRTTKGFECAVGPNFSLSGVGLAFAVGYNFKSGNLNIPINLPFVPGINKNGNYRDNDNNSINSIDLNNVMIENYIENLTRITISEESLKNLNLKLENNSYVFLTFITIIAPQLECLEFDNINYAINNGWDYITPTENCFGEDECSSSTSNNLNYINHKTIDKIYNLKGQRISLVKNQPVIEIYNDGTVEKKVIIE
jgi:hypothetical protein